MIQVDEGVLISAVEYATGRSTYVVGETVQNVRRAWPTLSESTKAVILRVVDREVSRSERERDFLGMPMDHAQWKSLLGFMGTQK